jgi:uncharacterized protein (DUF58 family)
VQVHPTLSSVDVAAVGLLAALAGVVTQEPAIVAWSGSLLLGLAVARAVTQLSVGGIRSAGFEMLWCGEGRLSRVARGEELELWAEIRNRDNRAVRYTGLRPVCSPYLALELDPCSGEVPAGGRLRVRVLARGLRVGQNGVFGLSLEVQGSPGLFEVPLTFANPYGIEVLPRAFSARQRSARGGRSRLTANDGRAGPLGGEGAELRELREHLPGDPFKRIAWKATARRGVLMVREYEREERDIVWLVLDASVELWAGAPGTAPLDRAVDEVAEVAHGHLARGDRVGLAIVAARRLAWLEPGAGPSHGASLLSALAEATACIDADRSDLDEGDLLSRVIEHLRPLDAAAQRVRSSDVERIMRRVERVQARAPFSRPHVFAISMREQKLRQYVAAFGLYAPPRLEPDREKTDSQLCGALQKIMRLRPRPSIAYVWSPAPDPGRRPELEKALLALPKRHLKLAWVTMTHQQSLPRTGEPVGETVSDAISLRCLVAQRRGERALRRMGIEVFDAKSRARVRLGAARALEREGAPGETQGREAS